MINLFFDLDGTISDSRKGICRCIAFALEQLGASVSPLTEYEKFIGPPLRDTFTALLNTDDRNLVETALGYYRQRYKDVGIFENSMYPGIDDVLKQLSLSGADLSIVTSKPQQFAVQIIEQYGLARYFTDIVGPELSGKLDNKVDLLSWYIKSRQIDSSSSVMIGDRREDIIAGKSNNTKTIGVRYGFSRSGEFDDPRPDETCQSPWDIPAAIKRLCL